MTQALKHQETDEGIEMLYMKIYILAQNIFLILVTRLSIQKLALNWRNLNNVLQILLLASSVFGLIKYLGPLYLWHSEDVKLYDFSKSNFKVNDTEIPWLEIGLIGSISMPFLLIFLMILTVLVVLCVYLKENFKLSRIFSKNRRESRPDKDLENEILRREFANGGHVELQEEIDEEDEELVDQQPMYKSKRQIMHFYINMMHREVFSASE